VLVAVARRLRIAQNCMAPVRVWRQPEIFWRSLIRRMSRSSSCRRVVYANLGEAEVVVPVEEPACERFVLAHQGIVR
jgi:hypothetical protein